MLSERAHWLNRRGRRARGQVGDTLSAAIELEKLAEQAHGHGPRNIDISGARDGWFGDADIDLESAALVELRRTAIDAFRTVRALITRCGAHAEARIRSLLAALAAGAHLAKVDSDRTPVPLVSERDVDVSREPDAAHAPPRFLAIV